MQLWRSMSPILAQISHNTPPMVGIFHGTQTFQIICSNQNVPGDVVQKVLYPLHMYFTFETSKGFRNNITQCINSFYKNPQEEVYPHALKVSQGCHTTLIIHTKNCNTDYFSSSFLLPFKNSPSRRNNYITFPALHLH